MSEKNIQDIDELIAGFFSIFDNRAQRAPNFSLLGSMFIPGAIITKCSSDQKDTMSLVDFVTPREVLFEGGTLTDFHEWEVTAQTFVNGVTATRICTYAKEGFLHGQLFSGSGMKSIQLVLTQEGWKILSILWEDIE
jgi:hypothetical protein